MRLVMLDTETTGLKVEEGHRLIEIGCVECVDRRATEREFHVYINPEREVEEGAYQVHGMSWDDLKDKPLFADVVDDFLDFVKDAHVVIHNAEFDIGFIDAELRRAKRDPFARHAAKITDSLSVARDLHPGQRNSLDALCQRYAISNEHRTQHGALLDARLLTDVYLAMTRGQDSLAIHDPDDSLVSRVIAPDLAARLRVQRASAQEREAHEQVLRDIDKACKAGALWTRQQA